MAMRHNVMFTSRAVAYLTLVNNYVLLSLIAKGALVAAKKC